MSDITKAAIKIQSTVRGWLYRKNSGRKSRCMEFRLKNILPNRKPPVYRKKSKGKGFSIPDKKIILIQKNIRGFLQRKKYRDLIIEKMLKEQEDHFKNEIEKIENEFRVQEDTPRSSNSAISKATKPDNRYLELPLPMSQRRNKYKATRRAKLYDYDYYILAATEIQRIFRGYITRKYFGTFSVVRERVIRVQRLYRKWRAQKEGQLELAATLMNKQTNILSTSYSSFLHLKSLILTQDRQGKYTKFINYCEDKLESAGVNHYKRVDKYLEERIKDLELEKSEQEINFREIIQTTKNKYKSVITEYLKGIKALKFGMEIAQKSNYEHISKLVKSLADASRDIDSDSFYETSTFLPDMSFIERSINII